MNLLLLDPAELAGDRAELGGRRARHATEVLGAKPGDRLRVGLVRGPTGVAEVESVAPERLVLRVSLEGGAAEMPAVELVLAMPRPKALGRVLQVAAQLGVARIDLVNAWKVDKSYFHSHVVEPARLAAELRLGCEQGATTWIPDIAVHPVLMRFLREDLAARARDKTRLVCHPRDAVPIERAATAAPVILAIGPEGGWIDREVASFADLGFAAVSLSERILRSDVAVASALAQLELCRRSPDLARGRELP